MPTLQWRGYRAYVVYSKQIDKKRTFKWVPLGVFDRKVDGQIAFAKHLQFNQPSLRGKEILFREIKDAYLENVKATRAQNNYLHQCNHAMALQKEFGALRLSDISPQAIESYIRKNNWKPTTWRNRLGLLRQIFNYADAHGFKTQKVFATIKIPSPKVYDFLPRLISQEIMDQVIGHLEDKYQVISQILRYTGMRPSEAFNLKREDIFKDKIRVQSQKVNRTRFIPIHPKIKDLLLRLPFKEKQGAFQHALQIACQRAGHPRALSPYIFRHQFASDIVNKTGNIRAAQQLLGHSTIQMTTRYAHAIDETLAKVIKEI